MHHRVILLYFSGELSAVGSLLLPSGPQSVRRHMFILKITTAYSTTPPYKTISYHLPADSLQKLEALSAYRTKATANCSNFPEGVQLRGMSSQIWF